MKFREEGRTFPSTTWERGSQVESGLFGQSPDIVVNGSSGGPKNDAPLTTKGAMPPLQLSFTKTRQGHSLAFSSAALAGLFLRRLRRPGIDVFRARHIQDFLDVLGDGGLQFRVGDEPVVLETQ